MKRILFMLFMAVISLNLCFAQDLDENIISLNVPKVWKLDSKVTVVNATPYWLNKVVVAEREGGNLSPICIINHIAPGSSESYDSFIKKTLSRLRGKTLAVKAKGVKLGNNGSYNKEAEYKADDPQVTYSYQATVSTKRHDLIITIRYVDQDGKDGESIMNF